MNITGYFFCFNFMPVFQVVRVTMTWASAGTLPLTITAERTCLNVISVFRKVWCSLTWTDCDAFSLDAKQCASGLPRGLTR